MNSSEGTSSGIDGGRLQGIARAVDRLDQTVAAAPPCQTTRRVGGRPGTCCERPYATGMYGKLAMAVMLVALALPACTSTPSDPSQTVDSFKRCLLAEGEFSHFSERLEREQTNMEDDLDFKATGDPSVRLHSVTRAAKYAAGGIGIGDLIAERCPGELADRFTENRNRLIGLLEGLQAACRTMMDGPHPPAFDPKPCTTPTEELTRWRACYAIHKYGEFETEFARGGFCAGRNELGRSPEA